MRSRSRSSRLGSPVSGSACRRRRLRTRCTTRPIQRSGASLAMHHAPRPSSTRKTTAPTIVTSTRLRSTAPRTIAGIARIGSARTTAKVIRLAAVRPDTAVPWRSPASTSILYCSAAPTAPPPGATLDSALPASWEVITAYQRRVCIATACSAHRHASASVCNTSIATSQPAPKRRMSLHDASTSRTLGATRYSDTPVTTSQIARLSSAGRGDCSASPRSMTASTSARSSIARSTRSPSPPCFAAAAGSGARGGGDVTLREAPLGPGGSLVGGHHADGDEVGGVQPRVGERDAAGVADRIAQADRPAVLDQRDRGGRAGGDGVVDEPEVLLVEDVAARLVDAGGAEDGARLRGLLAADSEPDQRAREGAELLGLLERQVGDLDVLEVALVVLAHDEQVDEAGDVARLQPLELGEDLAGELWLVEAHDEQLDGSGDHDHLASLLRQLASSFCLAASNSSAVSTPWSWSALSCCRRVTRSVAGAAGAG